jgi:hypothetical protein
MTIKNWVATKNITFQLQSIEKSGKRKILLHTKHEQLSVCKHAQEAKDIYVKKNNILWTKLLRKW